MKGQPWFRVWSRDALASQDLSALTATEELVWWRLLCVANEAESRGTVQVDAGLARNCKVSPAQLKRALATDEGVHVTPQIELCPPCALRVYALLRAVYDAAPRAERRAAS